MTVKDFLGMVNMIEGTSDSIYLWLTLIDENGSTPLYEGCAGNLKVEYFEYEIHSIDQLVFSDICDLLITNIPFSLNVYRAENN